ncbi:hypothetical protein RP20_CCG018798 [Aedes albopictus]|nr:hypothetical protein RP20_CCG018798 [Aedes albopictus]
MDTVRNSGIIFARSLIMSNGCPPAVSEIWTISTKTKCWMKRSSTSNTMMNTGSFFNSRNNHCLARGLATLSSQFNGGISLFHSKTTVRNH